MFYVKWFGQVMLVMVLMSIVALLVPPPEIAALMLISVIIWSLWLLSSLVRYLVYPSTRTVHSRRIERPVEFGLGAQVALTDSLTTTTEFFPRPPVAQRVMAANAAGTQRTCPRVSARVRQQSRQGRPSSASFVYCRARRRVPAA